MLDTRKRDISPEYLRDMDPSDLIEFGREMYRRDVLPRIPHVRNGMMVVLDMASGDYEIDLRAADAGSRLESRRPDAVLHIERVGSPAPFWAVSLRPARPPQQ